MRSFAEHATTDLQQSIADLERATRSLCQQTGHDPDAKVSVRIVSPDSDIIFTVLEPKWLVVARGVLVALGSEEE